MHVRAAKGATPGRVAETSATSTACSEQMNATLFTAAPSSSATACAVPERDPPADLGAGEQRGRARAEHKRRVRGRRDAYLASKRTNAPTVERNDSAHRDEQRRAETAAHCARAARRAQSNPTHAHSHPGAMVQRVNDRNGD